MKTKLVGSEMLAQCPDCQAIKMKTNNKYMPYAQQQTFVEFPKLPKEQCLGCKENKTQLST